jgi:hypothetical protein
LLRWLCKNIRIIQALNNFIEIKSDTDFPQSCCVANLMIFHKIKHETLLSIRRKNTLYCQNTCRHSYNICFPFSKDPGIFINLNLLSSSWYYFLSAHYDFVVIHNITFSNPVVWFISYLSSFKLSKNRLCNMELDFRCSC